MNDYLYDEDFVEEEYKERKFKKNKYIKRKHLLKDKQIMLFNKYYKQFGVVQKEVENFEINKVKFKIMLEIYNPKTRWTDYEFLEIEGWKTPGFWLRETETMIGVHHSFKKAKESFFKKFYTTKKDDFVLNKIKEKLKNTYKDVSSLGLCYKIIIRKEEVLEERKVSHIVKKYKEVIEIETKETENITFYGENLRKNIKGFIGKKINLFRAPKKDTWMTYPTKRSLVDKINKEEFLKELKYREGY